MDTSVDLAQMVLKAAELRENSFDSLAAPAADKYSGIALDYEQFYKLSLQEAVVLAGDLSGFDSRMDVPVYLLLKNSWNTSLQWARGVVDNN